MLIPVATVKEELRITQSNDDAKIAALIREAEAMLNQFSGEELTELSALQKRFVFLYCAIWYDGRMDLQASLNAIMELIRSDNE